MKETEIYNRTERLREKINDFLGFLNNRQSDYFSDLNSEILIKSKIALSDINNVLTLKTTLAFTNWLTKYFNLSESKRLQILQKIDETKPNTNGYDIELPDDKIIAEIKCIIPINGGNYYGAAQKDSILDDAIKLDIGKRNIKITKDYIKIIGLIDLGERTDTAITKLKNEPTKIRTIEKKRIARHDIIKKLQLLDDSTKIDELTTEVIYIKKIKI